MIAAVEVGELSGISAGGELRCSNITDWFLDGLALCGRFSLMIAYLS